MTIIKKLEKYEPIRAIHTLFFEEADVSFLESSLSDDRNRYSIIGRRPYNKIEKQGNKLIVNGEVKEEDFESYLKNYLNENRQENFTDLPLISGGIGYFSYDFYQNKNSLFPESIFIFYDEFIIEDHVEKQVYLVENGKTGDENELIEKLEATIKDLSKGHNFHSEITLSNYSLKADMDKRDYMKSTQKMIDHIVEGDVYVINLTQRLSIMSDVCPYQLYKTLQVRNPAPFSAYLNYENFQIISSSPECFIKKEGGTIFTSPIKGTRKRGETPEEDEELKNELAQSAKDKSELLMIVDLERNDLNQICVPGTVIVDELYAIETYATVHHLVSKISGTVKEDVDFMAILKAVFPGGSITGAPKRKAMEIIDQIEHSDRGIYTGIIGYYSFAGDFDWNIAIRTAIYHDNKYELGVGGGITYDSELLFEYEEIFQKAKAFTDILNPNH